MQTQAKFVLKECYRTKGVLSNCISVLYPKYFMLGKKAPCNGSSLDSGKPFDFRPIT